MNLQDSDGDGQKTEFILQIGPAGGGRRLAVVVGTSRDIFWECAEHSPRVGIVTVLRVDRAGVHATRDTFGCTSVPELPHHELPALMITLYGSARSRASRSLVALEELGLAYVHQPLRAWENDADRDTIQRINPSGRVPVLEDDGLVICESMAINIYLADRYGGALWPADARARAGLYQWSVWAQTEIDVMARHRARFSTDATKKARAEAERLAALAILDAALADRPYLLGASITLADINVATTLSEPWELGLVDGELNPSDHGLSALADWLRRCSRRASWLRVGTLP